MVYVRAVGWKIIVGRLNGVRGHVAPPPPPPHTHTHTPTHTQKFDSLVVAERAKRVEPHSQIMLLEIELFRIWSYIHRILHASIHARAQMVLS